MQNQNILIIAHRGASGLVKFENTLEAFEKAIELGVPLVEFDVRKTQDNFLICYHDESINGVRLADINYNQVLYFSRQQGFEVPLLEDVLKLCQGKIMLDIELKETGYEKEVINLVKRYLDYHEYVMKSFNDSSVLAIKKVDSNITTGLLLGIVKPKNLVVNALSALFPEYRLFKSKADFVSPNYHLLILGFTLRMKLLKKDIYVWTVNDEKLMMKVAKKGIFALITDRPDLATNLFGDINRD
ncbi:MAG: glycerophosphodiester phosphodiesterase [Xenococcaceae cyanobacterium]